MTKRGTPQQDTLRLSGKGAGMLLGDLEHALMEAAWRMDRPATAREIHTKVAKTRDIELITAVTVLNRLVEPKRVLRRRKIDDVFHYSAVLSRAEFLERGSRHVLTRVLALGTEAVTASFVDVLAERDPDQLAELGRLVRRKLREQKNQE
ncbi:MAG: BlaI/MecI/CopY family transcriptional regulator [Longimicrobiales bacterium]